MHHRIVLEITALRSPATYNDVARPIQAREGLLLPADSVQLRPSSIFAHDTRRSARLGGLRTASAGVHETVSAICGLCSLYTVPGVYAGHHTCMSTLFLGRK